MYRACASIVCYVEELVAHVIASVFGIIHIHILFYYGGRLNGQSFSFSFQLFRIFFMLTEANKQKRKYRNRVLLYKK